MNDQDVKGLIDLMAYVKAMEETIKKSPIGDFYQQQFPVEWEKASQEMKDRLRK